MKEVQMNKDSRLYIQIYGKKLERASLTATYWNLNAFVFRERGVGSLAVSRRAEKFTDVRKCISRRHSGKRSHKRNQAIKGGGQAYRIP